MVCKDRLQAARRGNGRQGFGACTAGEEGRSFDFAVLMEDKPIASVVIVTHNRQRDVLRAVASCLAQDCALEIIVYDDASEDGVAKALSRRFPNVRISTSR